MTPTETKNLNWKDAWWYLLNGRKIKRPLWKGYWIWENNTIMMHCRDGSVRDIRDTEFVAYTFSNIAQRDWMVVEEGGQVKRGRWLRYGLDGYPIDQDDGQNEQDTAYWQCDQCLTIQFGRREKPMKYCPKCMARMDGNHEKAD